MWTFFCLWIDMLYIMLSEYVMYIMLLSWKFILIYYVILSTIYYVMLYFMCERNKFPHWGTNKNELYELIYIEKCL